MSGRGSLPNVALRLYDELEASGWEPEAETYDSGTFRYRYSDGSSREFTRVPVVSVQATAAYSDGANVGVAVSWIRNPVSRRWMLTEYGARVSRVLRDDEMPSRVAVANEITRALGGGVAEWTTTLSHVRRLVASGPRRAAERVADWKATT